MNTICIAVPESLRYEANQFASCIGISPDDDKTFSHYANAVDSEGNTYIVSSGLVVPNFESIATSDLVEPEWQCDIDAAMFIQSIISVDTKATPESVTAVFGNIVDDALVIMGLVRLHVEV